MRKFPRVAAGLAALTLVLAATTAGLAANTVTIRVTENNRPVDGVIVEIYASDGASSFVTGADGEVTPELNGKVFRIKVNGVLQAGLHQTTEGTINVQIH